MGFDGSNKSSKGYGRDIKYHIHTSQETQQIIQEAMAKASPASIRYLDPLNYKGAKVLRDGADMTPEEWQDIRKYTIGSSAVSSVFGESPYPGCTNIDIYNQKIGVSPLISETSEEKERKELMFLYGHIMEEFLQKYTEQMYPDCELIIDTNIYLDPDRPFLSVNLDAMLIRPDGSIVHIEYKTASPHVKPDYDNNMIPQHYKRQLIESQHILGVWESLLIVAFGRDDIITRTYKRDLDVECEQIIGLENFWQYNVLNKIEPAPLGPPEVLIETFRKYGGYANKNSPSVRMPKKLLPHAQKIAELDDEISTLRKKISICEDLKAKEVVPLVQFLGTNVSGSLREGKEVYYVDYKPNAGRKKCDFEKLKNSYPEAFRSCTREASSEVSRTFKLKRGVGS